MKHTRRLFCILLTVCMALCMLPVQATNAHFAVSGLDVPQAGELIDFSAVSAAPAAYTVDEVCWYASSRAGMYDVVCNPGDTFAAGTYLCRVYLTLAGGITPAAGATGAVGSDSALFGLYRGRYYLECEYTAKPSTRISTLIFGGIERPAIGAPVSQHSGITLSEAAGCTITAVTWSLGGTALEPQITFRAGDQATCTVTVRANEGYRFTAQPSATLCGKANSAAVERIAEREYQFIFLFPVGTSAAGSTDGVKIGSLSVSLDAPVAGALPDRTAEVSTGVTVSAVSWSPNDEAFAEGGIYTVTVVLAAKDGYYFPAAPIVTLDGKAMQLGKVTTESLTAAYTFPAAAAEGYVFPFTDVAESAWYYTWVKGAHRMGLINGKSETLYAPDAEMTWAEAVKLAACMHQLYHDGKVTLGNGEPWYKTYMEYCLTEQIITEGSADGIPGYSELMQYANEPITRAAYVFLFSRALPAEAFPAINVIPDNAIPDVPISDSILDDSIYLFYRAGILNGVDTYGTFTPGTNIHRSDVAAILMRMMDPTNRVGAPALLD